MIPDELRVGLAEQYPTIIETCTCRGWVAHGV
jgi:hypothetical protein